MPRPRTLSSPKSEAWLDKVRSRGGVPPDKGTRGLRTPLVASRLADRDPPGARDALARLEHPEAETAVEGVGCAGHRFDGQAAPALALRQAVAGEEHQVIEMTVHPHRDPATAVAAPQLRPRHARGVPAQSGERDVHGCRAERARLA